MVGWPASREALEEVQVRLLREEPEPWEPPETLLAGAAFATFSTRADPAPAERGWAAAIAGSARAVLPFEVRAPYEAGYLALREGPPLERVVRALGVRPDVLLVDATGRDHPRGAGLALHLGAVLDLPTVGVTDRPLVAVPDEHGRLLLDGRVVGSVVRTRSDARPVFAHAAWRTDAETAGRVVLALSTGRARTPEPLRVARFLARAVRARHEGRLPPGWREEAQAPVALDVARTGW